TRKQIPTSDELAGCAPEERHEPKGPRRASGGRERVPARRAQRQREATDRRSGSTEARTPQRCRRMAALGVSGRRPVDARRSRGCRNATATARRAARHPAGCHRTTCGTSGERRAIMVGGGSGGGVLMYDNPALVAAVADALRRRGGRPEGNEIRFPCLYPER